MTFARLLTFVVIASSVLYSQTTPKPRSEVQTEWHDIDQLCGQLELAVPRKKEILVNGKAESRFYTAYLEHATVTLYPATLSEKDCCEAKPLATTQSRKYGAFEFTSIQVGAYWLRVQEDEFTRLIPVRVTRDFDQKLCFSPSVGRSVVVDSTPPKIKTRIR